MLNYFIYIIIKNVHLNTYKPTIYKFFYAWIFPLSYLTSTHLTPCTLYSPFLWNFVKIIRDKTRDLRFLWTQPCFRFHLFLQTEQWEGDVVEAPLQESKCRGLHEYTEKSLVEPFAQHVELLRERQGEQRDLCLV